MRMAIYKNPKSGKLYGFYKEDENDPNEELKIVTVFDNAKTYDKAELKADRNGKAYKICDVREKTLKNGFTVFVTTKGE